MGGDCAIVCHLRAQCRSGASACRTLTTFGVTGGQNDVIAPRMGCDYDVLPAEGQPRPAGQPRPPVCAGPPTAPGTRPPVNPAACTHRHPPTAPTRLPAACIRRAHPARQSTRQPTTTTRLLTHPPHAKEGRRDHSRRPSAVLLRRCGRRRPIAAVPDPVATRSAARRSGRAWRPAGPARCRRRVRSPPRTPAPRSRPGVPRRSPIPSHST